MSEAPIAITKAGQVRGFTDNGIAVFKGIPYGASTAGANRFAAPKTPAAWSGVRDCLGYGPRSPQAAGGGENVKLFTSWREEEADGEDCLVLNVWTPALADGKKRPVMVWFHGGGFASLSGSSKCYDGVNLCTKGDVVVVTLNHRLNVFGYVYLDEVGGKDAGCDANCGQLDLVHALKWVRDNITAFGGDPGNVMIFGESGGGAKVGTVMAMPAAEGLFHRAVIQSGSILKGISRQAATEAARGLLDALGVSDARGLKSKSTAEIIEAGNKVGIQKFVPVVDGDSLPRDPFDPDAPPVSARVPLMIGFNKDETSLFLPFFDLTWEDVPARLQMMPSGLEAGDIIAAFRKERPEAGPADIFFAISTAVFMGSNSWRIAERKAAQKSAPCYAYVVEWNTPVDGGVWRCPHAMEIPLVFDTVGYSAAMLGEDGSAQPVADQMSAAWLAFARTGDPNCDAIPRWRSFDAKSRAAMVFDTETREVEDHRGNERRLMERAKTISIGG